MGAHSGDERIRQVQTWLNNIGFKVDGRPLSLDGIVGDRTELAVRRFQAGWVPAELAVDGVPGPATLTALEQSVAWDGRASEHFRFREFRSKGNGDIVVERQLIVALERMRLVSGGPIAVLSGYRDPAHNKSVGGAKHSQHLFGRAVDPIFRGDWLGLEEVRAMGLFSGIGHRPSRGRRVEHVDIRTSATPARPTTWAYGQ